MSNVQVFNFEANNVRTIVKDGKPWFVAKDVADVLGYTNSRKAILDHCKGGNEALLPSDGGDQTFKIIPESDVYRLIFRSKLPAAEKFEAWVTEEVLPSIRQGGQYTVGQAAPQSFAEALRLAADQQERIEAAQLQLGHKDAHIEKLEHAVAVLAPQAEVAQRFLLEPRFLTGTKLSDLHNTVVAHYAIKTPLFFQALRDAGVLWSSTKSLRPTKPYVINVDPTKVWFCRPLDVVGDYEVTPAGAVGILCLMRDRGVPATRLTRAEANERIRQGWELDVPTLK